MPLYFVTFLGMLAASLLLFMASVGYAALTRRSPPALLPETVSSWLQAAGLALLWFGVGVCWLLFFNVYRMYFDMSAVGDAMPRMILASIASISMAL